MRSTLIAVPASFVLAGGLLTAPAALAAGAGSSATPSTSALPAATTSNQAVFSYTGGPQDWPIPRGVQSVYVTLVGAPGGAVTTTDNQGTTVPIPGGSPAQVTGTLALAPGTGAVDVWVGGPGGSLTNTGTPGTGGFNGGAGGGTGSWSPGASLPGAGGGGATDLRIGGYLPSTRVMVAGGGGGAGGAHQADSGQGYAPGGTGGNGGTGTPSAGVFPAQAGGNASGDNAGAGGAGGVDPNGQGSIGDSADTGTGNAGGGGGAGGWYGGAGGQAGKSGLFGYAAAAGGGGGGSSYASPSQVTNATATLAPQGATSSATFQWVDISTTALPPLAEGTSMSQQLSATFAGPPGTMVWQVTNGSLPAGLTLSSNGLLSGTPTRAQRFSFTVSAAASSGVSPVPFAVSTATFTGDVRSSTVPGVPTAVTAVGGAGTATVSWVAPTFSGSSPLTSYQVRWSADAGATWSAPVSTPATLTSYTATLAGGLTYLFQVAASNVSATGLWSASSNAVAVTSPTNAPSNVTGTPAYESVALTWTAPTQTGGAPVTGYLIRYSTDGGGAWATMPNTGSTATTATVSNLTSQAGYIFEVQAVNSAGLSPWSTASSIVYPVLDPNAPSDVVGTSAYQAVELTWLAPPNPAVPVTGYLVRYSDDSGTTWSNPVATGSALTTYDYTGLTQPDYLIFEVAAVNANGTSAWSSPSAPVTAETRASPPTKLRAYPGDQAVVLTWNPPADLGGGSLTGYRIDYRLSGTDQWKIHTASTGTGATRYNVTQLTNGTSYDFRVAAITSTFGVGFFSQMATGSPYAVPGRPTDVRASAGNASATITWKAPAQDFGRRVVGYRIEAATSTGWYLLVADTRSTATTYSATGLVNGETYLFRVSAINVGGVGDASTPSNAVTPSATPPSTPRWVSVLPGDTKAQITWQAPLSSGTSPVTAYVVQASVAGGPWAEQCATASLSCTVDGLSSSLPYRFRVAASSAAGQGSWSAPTKAMIPSPVPSRPLVTSVEVDGSKARVGVAPGSLGKVSLEHWDPNAGWKRVRNGEVALGKGIDEVNLRAVRGDRVSPLVRVDVKRPSKAALTVVLDGDRSRITSPRGSLSWRYGDQTSWTAVPKGSFTLRYPQPPRAWTLQVREPAGGIVTIGIR